MQLGPIVESTVAGEPKVWCGGWHGDFRYPRCGRNWILTKTDFEQFTKCIVIKKISDVDCF